MISINIPGPFTAMPATNVLGWSYTALLLVLATFPLWMRPKKGMKVGGALMIAFSIPLGVIYFATLSAVHLDLEDGHTYYTFFDLSGSWAASHPVWGWGAVMFAIWPVLLGAAVLLAYGFSLHRMKREEKANFQARLAALAAESSAR